MVSTDRNFAIFLQVWFIISPLVILYLYRKVNFYKSSGIVKVTDEATKVLNSMVKDFNDYQQIIEVYGSIQGYEDARMKDFEVMREYFKKVLKTLIYQKSILMSLLNNIDVIDGRSIRKTTKEFISYIIEDYSKCIDNLQKFIKSEEEAHVNGHSPEEINEERKKKDEKSKKSI